MRPLIDDIDDIMFEVGVAVDVVNVPLPPERLTLREVRKVNAEFSAFWVVVEDPREWMEFHEIERPAWPD